jgi:urocanate hydratase
MSGAQPKAAVITGAIGVTAEINRAPLEKRFKQGWVQEVIEYDVDALIARVRRALAEQKGVSIGFLGNIVDVWERFVEEHKKTGDLLVHLGSDQTSLHNPFNGGYYPAGLTFDESNELLARDPARFKELVEASLRRHADAINYLADQGMRFWDYGNAFLVQASRAGASVMDEKDKNKFRYPSYVQDVMGDVFSLGYGPFRWICTSGDPADLAVTDEIAKDVITKLMAAESDPRNRQMYQDTLDWVSQAAANKMVVGSQARILYANALGRVQIALAINDAIREGKVRGPVALSRDHHDVSGADSPYRETSNIYDGSQVTADMSFHTVVGNAMRGATWVALHNGGGVGWGLSQNCGFGLVLDGTPEASSRCRNMLFWDVNNGVARRAWSRNQNAYDTVVEAMREEPRLRVTLPSSVDASVLDQLLPH